MATHSSILAWRIPRTEEPDGLSPWGQEESNMTEHLCIPRLEQFCHSPTVTSGKLPCPPAKQNHPLPPSQSREVLYMFKPCQQGLDMV